MKKKLLCLLLGAVMLLSCACEKTNEKPIDGGELPTSGGAAEDSATNTVDVVKDGRSDFAIVVKGGDPSSLVFAQHLQNLIYKKTGVLIPTRSPSFAGQYESKILIGGQDQAEVAALAEQTDRGEFSWSVTEHTVVLYARDVYGFLQLEDYVSSVMLADGGKDLCLTKGLQAGIAAPSQATLQKDAGTYHLVYDPDAEGHQELAVKAGEQIAAATGLTVTAVPDSGTYSNEIHFGRVDRSESSAVAAYLSGGIDYIAGVFNGTYSIQFGTSLGMAIGMANLIESIKKGPTVSSEGVVSGNSEEHPQDALLAVAVKVTQQMNGTYGNWIDKALKSNSEVRADQALIDALVERMGDSVALSVGSSSALYRGYVVKLDPADYSRATRITEQGHLLIPSAFAKEYFGVDLPSDADGYVDVTAYCGSASAYSVFYLSSSSLAIITPADVPSFANAAAVIGGYQNMVYLARMKSFFNNSEMPEPSLNTEQTRVVLDHVDYSTAYLEDYTKFQYVTFYSPAITTAQESGKTVLYAAYEYAQVLNHSEKGTVTYLKRSTDQGKTWEKVGEVDELRWASLFEWQGKIYLLGDDRSKGTAVIARFDPFTGQTVRRDLGVKMGGGAPNVVGFANGRIYKAYNNGVLSAADTADLLSAASWVVSNDPQTLITRAEYNEITGKTSNPNNVFRFEEGNVIVTPEGKLYVMYRIDAAPTIGYTAFFELSANGKTLSVVQECRGIVKFPYTQSKFSVRYDAATGLYLSLTSLDTAQNDNVYQRNVLGLVASKDLIHWEVIEVLLVDREMVNSTYSIYAHGFQYVDFVISDGNLYFLVREAVGDTIRFHDAKDLTFYTLENYAEVIRNSGKFPD